MPRFWFLLSFAILTSCALPAMERDIQAFVPDRDLTVVSLVREGLAYYRKSRFVEAEFAFRKALYLYPRAANVKANLAAALRASGQFDEAEDILFALNAGAPKSLEYLTGLARLYVEKKDYASARKFFIQAFDTALEAKDWAAAGRFAQSLSAIAFRIGDERAALCDSELAQNLNAAENISRHGRLLLATHQGAKAHDLLKSTLNQAGAVRDPNVVHQLAIAQFALGNYREAFDLERNVLETAGEERNLQSEARLVATLAQRHLQVSDEQFVDTSVEDAAVQEESKGGLGAAVDAISEKSSLYWPLPLLEEVAAIPPQEES